MIHDVNDDLVGFVVLFLAGLGVMGLVRGLLWLWLWSRTKDHE